MRSVSIAEHNDARAFLNRAGKFLEAREAENNLILGLCSGLIARPESCANPYLVTVETENAITTAALMTPPRKLVVVRAKQNELAAIAHDLLRKKLPVSGIIGPNDEAKRFAEVWSRDRGVQARDGRKMRIFELQKVIHPAYSRGHMRVGTNADTPIVMEWGAEFAREANTDEKPDTVRETVGRMTSDGRLFVWEDGQVVSMAVTAGTTSRGIRISLVYTPPEFRKRGYATSLVAAMSQRLLDSGRKFCFLYTDLANPTSNAIYQRIGYTPVCDCCEYYFE